MRKRGKLKPPAQKISSIKSALEDATSVTSLRSDNYFRISFRHFDKVQGQTYFDWEQSGMLGKAVDTLANHCCGPLKSQLGSKTFKHYGSFPPSNKTAFTHPKSVPPDAEWARISVDGKHRIIGHIVNETFYVVFLDANHTFWKSEKKHT